MEESYKMLIIEDEEPMREGLVDAFESFGHSVDYAQDGEEGLEMALSGVYDLILLDINLPRLNGFEVCNRIRERSKEQPIIMLTARVSEKDLIEGLTLGADDYITKPFSLQEVVVRIKAVLRRSSKFVARKEVLKIGSLEVDFDRMVATSEDGGDTIEFTKRELEVVSYLAERRDRVVSKEELLNVVWGYEKSANLKTKTVEIHIAKLRKKLEPDPKEPRYIQTYRGVGYRLVLSPGEEG